MYGALYTVHHIIIMQAPSAQRARNVSVEGLLRPSSSRACGIGSAVQPNLDEVFSAAQRSQAPIQFIEVPRDTRDSESVRSVDVYNHQFMNDQELRKFQDSQNRKAQSRNIAQENQLFRGTYDLASGRKAAFGAYARPNVPSLVAPSTSGLKWKGTRFDTVQHI